LEIASGKLRVFSRSIREDNKRDKLADSKSESKQWKDFDCSISTNDHINRCLESGLGHFVGANEQGVHDLQIAILNFSKFFPEVKEIHIQTDNIVALTYLVKIGGGESGPQPDKQGDLGRIVD